MNKEYFVSLLFWEIIKRSFVQPNSVGLHKVFAIMYSFESEILFSQCILLLKYILKAYVGINK
jgi:hypothetical protein